MIFGWKNTDDEDDLEKWDDDKFFWEDAWQETSDHGRIYMVVEGLYFHKKSTRQTFDRLKKDIESLKDTVETLKLQVSELQKK